MKKATCRRVTYRTKNLSINKILENSVSLNLNSEKIKKIKISVWNERIEIAKKHRLEWFLGSTIKAMENIRDSISSGGMK
tara:strand:+ start:234 stop:473 length:240 start_codon:yes stop_codon:yes gene_type:complete